MRAIVHCRRKSAAVRLITKRYLIAHFSRAKSYDPQNSLGAARIPPKQRLAGKLAARRSTAAGPCPRAALLADSRAACWPAHVSLALVFSGLWRHGSVG